MSGISLWIFPSWNPAVVGISLVEAIWFYGFTHWSSSQQHLTLAAVWTAQLPSRALCSNEKLSRSAQTVMDWRNTDGCLGRASRAGHSGCCGLRTGGTSPVGRSPPPPPTPQLPPWNEIDAAEPQPPGRTSVWRRRHSLRPAESSSSGNNLLMESKDVSMVMSPRSLMTNHFKRAQVFWFFLEPCKSSKEHEEVRCSVSHIRLKKLRSKSIFTWS